jgi:hypothetical protein
VLAHDYNSSTWESESEKPQAPGHPRHYGEPILKQNRINQDKKKKEEDKISQQNYILNGESR